MARLLSQGLKADSFDSAVELRNGIRRKEFKYTFYVLVDDANETEDDVLAVDGIPVVGSTLRGCICKKVTPKEVDSAAGLWEVEAEFDSDTAPSIDPDANQPFTPPENPEEVSPTWKWGTEHEEANAEFDAVDGRPILNSAGEPMNMKVQIPIPVLTIVRYNSPSFDCSAQIQNYCGRLNGDIFWGWPPKHALMSSIEDEAATIFGLAARKVTYTIKFRALFIGQGQTLTRTGATSPAVGKKIRFFRDPGFITEGEWVEPTGYSVIQRYHGSTGWMGVSLDQGTRFFQGTGDPNPSGDHARYVNEYHPILDSKGKKAKGNLNGFGFKLTVTEEEVYLAFNKNPVVPFAPLGLGPFV